MPLRFLVAFLLLCVGPQQTPAPQPTGIDDLVLRLEAAAKDGDRTAVVALAGKMASLGDLPDVVGAAKPSRAVLKERDRVQTDNGGHRLMLELFLEIGTEGRLSTWSVDVGPDGAAWKIASATRLANVTGLNRLSLAPGKQFAVKDLTVQATDLALHLPAGSAFVAETADGVTGVVLLGTGEMRFTPPDDAERTQIRIFTGHDALRTPFDAVFVRMRPSEFARHFAASALTPRPVAAADLRRAVDVFDTFVGRTLQIDLADLSTDTWSITPQTGDFIAEVRTRRHGTLTYTRSHNDAEDISLFDRERRRNISVYASKEKLAQRGRFYSEDDLVDYDVLDYDIAATFSPERTVLEGTARVKIKVRAGAVSTLSLRLAESLNVRSVHSDFYGRVLHLRVIGQNSLLVNFPGFVVAGTEMWLTIQYGGRVLPQELDREAISVEQDAQENVVIPPEPRLLYSHRAYWYPQSPVSDYATAKVSLTVPAEYDVVATGAPVHAEIAHARGTRVAIFQAERPVRYLAFVVSRLRKVAVRDVDGVRMGYVANPRQVSQARNSMRRTEEVFRYYSSLLGRSPYTSFTVAFTERNAPGGHSPSFFAVVDQPVQVGLVSWRGDPVSFEAFPDFFLAHEIAHQWWGQAVGWKNYHEQWISEGFAQYFAVMYAEKTLSRRSFLTVLRQMNRTAAEESDQGPIYLGYRLGHIKREATIFRSLVYNKSAMVLHMLRRFIGDEAFFAGLRQFYQTWEFKKAGTADFQRVMERASGENLAPFFETWIFGATIPAVKFTHTTEGSELVLRLEQLGDPVMVPITVTLTDTTGSITEVVVRLRDRVTVHRLPHPGRLRSAVANADFGSLATVR